MAHGAGGKATQTLIEGLLRPGLRLAARSRRSPTPARCRSAASHVALTTDSFVVKPIRFPGGSIGELAVNGTVNDLAVAGARPLALSLVDGARGGPRRRRAARRGRGDRRGGRRRPASRSSPATRRSSSAATPTRCTSARPASARSTRARRCRRRACARATASSSRARSATTGRRSCWRAASSSSTPPSSPTRARCGRPSTRCSTPRARGLRCMRDATRGGVASVLNELARASGVAMVVREGDVPGRSRRWPGAAEILGIDPMYVANEGKLVAFVAPEAADAALAALRAVPGCERAVGDRRGEDRAARDGARARRRSAASGSWTSSWATRCPGSVDRAGRSTDGRHSRVRTGAAEDGAGHRPRAVDDHGALLRGRLGGHDLGHQPQPRGHHPGRHPRHAAGGHPQPGDRLRGRPGVHPGLVRRRAGQARPVRPDHRGLDRQRGDQRRGPLDRLRRQPRRTASPSPPTSGSTASPTRPRRSSRSGRAPPTAASRR